MNDPILPPSVDILLSKMVVVGLDWLANRLRMVHQWDRTLKNVEANR